MKNQKSKRAVGRPTAYRPEYAKAVTEVMQRGLSATAFGATIGVSRQTISRWRTQIREFSEAVNKGESMRQAYYEGQLSKISASGNVAACIFALKNISPEEWRDRQDPLVNMQQRQTIVGFPEDLLERARAAAQKHLQSSPHQPYEDRSNEKSPEEAPNLEDDTEEEAEAPGRIGELSEEEVETLRQRAAEQFQARRVPR